MRRSIVLLFALLFSICSAKGDTRSAEIMSRLTSTIKGYKGYQTEFSISIDPVAAPDQGRFIVSGEKYYFDMDDIEIYYDGKTKYEVNSAYREVTVEKINPKDKSIFSNPAEILDFSDDFFTHSYGHEAAIDSRKCDVIILRPKDAGNPVDNIELSVARDTGLPVEISYRMTDASASVKVKIKSIKSLPAVPATQFVFDKAKYKSFDIIDLR